jgi:hypothetical protein
VAFNDFDLFLKGLDNIFIIGIIKLTKCYKLVVLKGGGVRIRD